MSELQLPQGEPADFSQGEAYVIDDATTALLIPVNRHLLDASRTALALLIAELLSLLAGPGTPAASAPTPQVLHDPFTESEIRILRYLPTHLTAREIAGQLHVSAHTVTTHMRHLYAKLGVHRRHEAVAQARALGLLSPSSRWLGYVPRYSPCGHRVLASSGRRWLRVILCVEPGSIIGQMARLQRNTRRPWLDDHDGDAACAAPSLSGRAPDTRGIPPGYGSSAR